MSASGLLRHSWQCQILAAGAVGLILLASVGVAGDKTKKQPAPTAAEMVDALITCNKAPKLLDRPGPPPNRVPLFPKDYDWKEYRRVREALDKLWQSTSVELWEELVRRSDDRHYCITAMNDNETGDNFTVGSCCAELAYAQLGEVYQRHLPRNPRSPLGFPIYVRVLPQSESLKQWRTKRANKSLYQVQIEVCERAIQELEKVEEVSKKEKARARKKIEGEIEKLRTTKQPDIFKDSDSRTWNKAYDYNPHAAKLIQEAVESGSLERPLDLGIIK